jgi:hypothetical protein
MEDHGPKPISAREHPYLTSADTLRIGAIADATRDWSMEDRGVVPHLPGPTGFDAIEREGGRATETKEEWRATAKGWSSLPWHKHRRLVDHVRDRRELLLLPGHLDATDNAFRMFAQRHLALTLGGQARDRTRRRPYNSAAWRNRPPAAGSVALKAQRRAAVDRLPASCLSRRTGAAFDAAAHFNEIRRDLRVASALGGRHGRPHSIWRIISTPSTSDTMT